MTAENDRLCPLCREHVPPEYENCPNCGMWMGVVQGEVPETIGLSEQKIEALSPEESASESRPLCPFCNRTYPQGAYFCPYCKTQIGADAERMNVGADGLKIARSPGEQLGISETARAKEGAKEHPLADTAQTSKESLPPMLEVRPKSSLNFQEVSVGDALSRFLTVRNSGDNVLEFRVRSSHPSLVVEDPDKVYKCSSGKKVKVPVTLSPDDTFLQDSPPRLSLSIESNAGDVELGVRYSIALPSVIQFNTNYLEVTDTSEPQTLTLEATNIGRSVLEGQVKVTVPWLRLERGSASFRMLPGETVDIRIITVPEKIPSSAKEIAGAIVLETTTEPQMVAVRVFPKPVLEVAPLLLDFGVIDFAESGLTPEVVLSIRNAGNGQLQGEIILSYPWLRVSSQTISCQAKEKVELKVAIHLDKLRRADLSGEQRFDEGLLVKTNGGNQAINCNITIRPFMAKVSTPASAFPVHRLLKSPILLWVLGLAVVLFILGFALKGGMRKEIAPLPMLVIHTPTSTIIPSPPLTPTSISIAARTSTQVTSQMPSSSLTPAIVLFQDDFSDVDSGWEHVQGDNWAASYSKGKYRIFVNQTSVLAWAHPGLHLEDTRIEVDATKVGGSDDNNFGILCRYRDADHFYLFAISSDGYYMVGKPEKGEISLIGMAFWGYSDTIRQGNATNHIRADCIGDTLSFYANGALLIKVRDSSILAGDVGLFAGAFAEPGTDILFDNFLVLNPYLDVKSP